MTVGVENPAGALALLAVAALVALHLWERRRRVIPSATLFLWQRLPASDLERERLRADLLFLLQLALCLALAVGYLRPYVERAVATPVGGRLVLVLDVSASMQAREAGGTRFELARRRARALVAALGTGDEAMVVAAGERAHVVARWSSARAQLEDRLEALEPLDVPTNLPPALEIALGEAAARAGTRVTVLTDLPPGASGLDDAGLAVLDWVQIGATDDNAAIAALAVEQPPFRDVAATAATVLVRNYAHARRDTVLEARVDGALWARRPLALAARGSEHVRLEAPPRAGELVVTLAGGDALAVDDRAVGWIGAAPPLDLLAVGDDGVLDELAAHVAAHVERVPAARWSAAARVDHRTVVFDGVAPDPPPLAPAVYLAPPPGNRVCPSGATVEAAAAVDWEDDDPVLGGIGGLDALAVTHASRLAVPDWGTPVVLGAAPDGVFPLLVAGEVDGRRTACLAATLRPPLADSDQLPLLLLTLAALRWVAQPAEAQAITVPTGVPIGLGGPAPDAAPPGLRVAGEPPVVIAERAGTYRVGDRVVVANLFDDRESDIGRSDAREWPATAAMPLAPRGGSGRGQIAWWLYLAAAALLAVEWLAWRRRTAA